MITNLRVDLRLSSECGPHQITLVSQLELDPALAAADPAAAPQLQLAGSVTTGTLSFSGLPAAGAR